MRHSRVESLGSPNKVDELNKLYLRQQFKANVTKFPILKKIQQEVAALQKLEQETTANPFTSAAKSNELWHSGFEVDAPKSSDLKQLIDKANASVLSVAPHVHEQFRQFLSQQSTAISIHELSRSESLLDTFIQSYQSTLRLVISLLRPKQARRIESVSQFTIEPKKADQVATAEIVSLDVQRQHSQSIMKTDNKSLQKRINELQVQNLKLGLEVTKLGEKLRQFETSQDIQALREQIEQITQESEEQIRKLTTTNEAKDKQIIKNNQLVVQLKAVIAKLEAQIAALQQYIDDNQARFTEMERTYNSVFEDRRYWREIAKMQAEDLDSALVRFQHYVKEELKSRRKLMTLQTEMDKIKIEKSKQVHLPEVNREAQDRLEKLTYLFTQDKFYFVQMKDLVHDKLSKANEQEQHGFQFLKNLRYDNRYQDELRKYTYPRQSFLIFYENQMKMIESEYRNIEHHRISLTFFATIRAIMDSKHNEFLYNAQNLSSSPKFADFVYAWISTFNIDKQTRKVIYHRDKNQTLLDSLRMDFLLDILNPKFSRINECITFSEFLFEQGSLDELYYYLHIRFLLFQGNVSNQSRYSFETIMYVKLKHAERITELVMHKYDPNNLIQAKATLREQSVVKAKRELIDGHYVLRILLELYRQERKNRLTMLKEMFQSCIQLQSSGKFGINYRNFRKVFQFNFPEASEVEVCSLFREAHMCGDGNVSAESFFTAANESNFFIKQLQMKSLFKAPFVEYYKIAYCEANLPYLDFINNYSLLPHKMIGDLCIELGLEPVHNELKQIQQYVDGMLQDPYNHYSLIQNVVHLLGIYHKLVMIKIDQNTILTGEMQTMEFEHLKLIISNLQQLFQPILEMDQKDKLQQITKHQKIRAVQIAGKRRAQKFYALLSALLATKLNQQQQQQSQQRKSMEDLSPKKRFTRQASIKF